MQYTSVRQQHNTPQIEGVKVKVRVIHPHHYLFGKSVEIVRNIRDSEDVVIQLPDKTYTLISLQLTDYYSPEGGVLKARAHLLDIDGLIEVVKLIDSIRSRESLSPNKDMPED